MMSNRLIIFIFILVSLTACGRPVTNYQAVITLGHEVRTVRLCGQTESYWLDIEPDQLAHLNDELHKISQGSYRQAYFEFSGQQLDTPPGELAKNYIGSIRFEQIIKIDSKVPPTCQNISSDTAPAEPQTFVFNCSDKLNFVARKNSDDNIWLFLPTGTIELKKEESGLYRLDGTTFLLAGEKGQLEDASGTYACRNNRRAAIWEHAKLNGADFRATGNEPGWVLEIRQQEKIFLETNYGSEQYEFDLPEAQTDPKKRTTRYHIKQSGQILELKLSAEPCRDTMSGEAFESRVEINLNGKILNGCGKALH